MKSRTVTVRVSLFELQAYNARVERGELERGELSRRVRGLLRELAGDTRQPELPGIGRKARR